MTWIERLRPTIKLTAPDGDFFEAAWIGNPRKKSKKLGIFSYPHVNGSKIQDLGVTGNSYPLTISFEGPENDTEAQRFYGACDQKGPWQIVHPVIGAVALRLVSIEEDVQPVTSGNITQISLEWIDDISDEVIASTQEIAAQVSEDIDALNDVTAEELTDVDQSTYSRVASIRAAITKGVDAVQDKVATASAAIATVSNTLNAIQRGIQETLSAVILDPLKLAGQVKEMIQLPSLIAGDFQTRLSAYSDMFDEVFGAGVSEESTPEARNEAVSLDFIATSALGAVAQIGTSSEFQSRQQVISAIESITEYYKKTTDALDATQSNFDGLDLGDQYNSQPLSYDPAARLIALTQAYLIKASFDLAIERVVTLEKPMTPMAVVIKYYGTLGEADENYDAFIDYNNLGGKDILLLDAGRKVKIYV